MAKLVYGDIEKEVGDNSPIRDVCTDIGVPFGCRKGVCGSCAIEIQEGTENLGSKNEKEVKITKGNERVRLACQCSITSGTVRIVRFA
ncbi:(2Fe-2S)-binding protein [Candidatus Woesearchaeota archaeon]|nr:(2Fe-2S)-binding protein [Candidatus Woesearchaeota archaeon]